MTWIEGYATAAEKAMWKKCVENLCSDIGVKKIGEQEFGASVVKSNLVALPELYFH